MSTTASKLSNFQKENNLQFGNLLLPVISQDNPLFIMILQDFFLIDANAVFLKAMQTDLADIVNQDIRRFTHEESLKKLTEVLENSSDENNYQGILKLKWQNAVSLVLNAYSFNFRLCKAKYTCIIAYEMNKYDRILEEPFLSNNIMSTILADMPEIVEIEAPDQTLLFINDGGCRFFGKPREELIGKNGLEMIYEEDRDKTLAAISSGISSNRPSASVDLRLMRGDGILAWVSWTGRVLFDASGEFIGHLSIGRDVTAKKQAEEELQRLKEELEQRVCARTADLEEVNQKLSALNDTINNIYMHIPLGILVADGEGHISNRNDFLKKLWGNFLPQVTEKISEEIRQGQNQYFNNLFNKGNSFQDVEMSFRTKDKNINCHISGVPMDSETNKKNFAVIIIRPSQEILKLVNRISGANVHFQFSDIVTCDKKMIDSIANAQRVARTAGNILITGESGTGKEMFAQAIHNYSNRSGGPFIGINCGAIPRDLIGSELFGYSEGAFTGAKKGGKPGKFELAAGGTIFLDEIGDMPLDQQVALLRVIQERSLTRIGGNQAIPIDVRIICATNKDLLAEVQKNCFRKDLYYRLNVIHIHIPPLRERHDDIVLLLNYFLQSLAEKLQVPVPKLSAQVQAALTNYAWPGNVRELQNIAERLLYMSADGTIPMELLPQEILTAANIPAPASKPIFPEERDINLKEYYFKKKEEKQQKECQQIMDLIDLYDGNLSKIAKELGISRSTLYAKINEYK